MTLIGFAYGNESIWPAFLLGTLSSLLGGLVAFVSVRVSPQPAALTTAFLPQYDSLQY
jgi:membrane protein YqaA with SNARE-associated domain